VVVRRENKGFRISEADWDVIRAVRAAVSVPVLANGNIHWCDAAAHSTAAHPATAHPAHLADDPARSGQAGLSGQPAGLSGQPGRA
jgi:hypothetical protein